jgi:hypothetical protein
MALSEYFSWLQPATDFQPLPCREVCRRMRMLRPIEAVAGIFRINCAAKLFAVFVSSRFSVHAKFQTN